MGPQRHSFQHSLLGMSGEQVRLVPECKANHQPRNSMHTHGSCNSRHQMPHWQAGNSVTPVPMLCMLCLPAWR